MLKKLEKKGPKNSKDPLPRIKIYYRDSDLLEPAGIIFMNHGIYDSMLDFTAQACLKGYTLSNDPRTLSQGLQDLKAKLVTSKDKEIANLAFAYAQAREEMRNSLEIYLDTFNRDFAAHNIILRLKQKD